MLEGILVCAETCVLVPIDQCPNSNDINVGSLACHVNLDAPDGPWREEDLEQEVVWPPGGTKTIQWPHRVSVWDPLYLSSPSEAHYVEVWHWGRYCADGPLGTESCAFE